MCWPLQFQVVSRNPVCEEDPETACLGEYVCIIPMTTFPIHNMVCDTITVFSTAYTHFQNFASFFQNFTHKSNNFMHKMQNASHLLMKHCIQNITNTSQRQMLVLCCKHLWHNIIFLHISYTHTVIQNLKLFFH